MLDALMGEVLTTCEKISWLNGSGEEALKKSYRKVNMMMLHKTAYVEYVPLGVLGVIAPWNYPFCNLMNHILSGLFSGNAVLVKVSEVSERSERASFEEDRRCCRHSGCVRKCRSRRQMPLCQR